MLAQLSNRLELLTRGPRDAPERHRTLRYTIDWSHELLSPAERTLFRRVSVFMGGCTLDAAEAVCNIKEDLGVSVLDGLASLIDQSLVWRPEWPNHDARFQMLETIQEYGRERLVESGEDALVRRAHAAYCLMLAEEAEVDLAAGRAQGTWIERLDLERDNIRRALDWLAANGNAEWGLRLCNALYLYWKSRAPAEGRDHLLVFARTTTAAGFPQLRTKALSAAGGLAIVQADFASARELNEQALALNRQIENPAGVLVCLNNLAVLNRDQGDFAGTTSLLREILAIVQRTADRRSVAHAISNLADVARAEGDFVRARSLHEECLAICRELGDLPGLAWSLDHQADVAHAQGDMLGARELYERALGIFRELDIQPGVARCLADLGVLAHEQGDFRTAHSLLTRALAVFRELGETVELARVLDELVSCSIDQGDCEGGLELAAAATALRSKLGSQLPPSQRARVERALLIARDRLGATASASAWMEGTAMGAREAMAYATSGSR